MLRLLSQEFYATCVRDQESLVSQMGWANAQAEKSRAERGLTTPIPSSDGGFEDRMGNMKVTDEEPSLPERVFLELLAASDELTQVRHPPLVSSQSRALLIHRLTGTEALRKFGARVSRREGTEIRSREE